jgi:hypothetical protein
MLASGAKSVYEGTGTNSPVASLAHFGLESPTTQTANFTVTNGAEMDFTEGGIVDVSPAGNPTPTILVYNGGTLNINTHASNLEGAVQVGQAGAGGSPSNLIFDSALTGNVTMVGGDSISVANSSRFLLRGGNANGTAGGIVDAVMNGNIPISIDSTSSLVDEAAGGTTVQLTATVDNYGTLLLTGASSGKVLSLQAPSATALTLESGSFLYLGNSTTVNSNSSGQTKGTLMDKGGTIRVHVDWTDPLTSTHYVDTGSAAATIDGTVNKTAGGNIDLSQIPSPRPGVPIFTDTLTITGDLTWGSSTTTGQLLIALDTANAGVTSKLAVNGNATIQNWDGTHGVQLNVAEFPPATSSLPNGTTTWTFFTWGTGKTLSGGFVLPLAGSPANTYTINNGTADQHLTLANPAKPLKVKR